MSTAGTVAACLVGLCAVRLLACLCRTCGRVSALRSDRQLLAHARSTTRLRGRWACVCIQPARRAGGEDAAAESDRRGTAAAEEEGEGRGVVRLWWCVGVHRTNGHAAGRQGRSECTGTEWDQRGDYTTRVCLLLCVCCCSAGASSGDFRGVCQKCTRPSFSILDRTNGVTTLHTRQCGEITWSSSG